MAVRVIFDCSNHSQRDKLVYLYRIPTVTSHYREGELKLLVKRRAGFLPAIPREDPTDGNIVENY